MKTKIVWLDCAQCDGTGSVCCKCAASWPRCRCDHKELFASKCWRCNGAKKTTQETDPSLEDYEAFAFRENATEEDKADYKAEIERRRIEANKQRQERSEAEERARKYGNTDQEE